MPVSAVEPTPADRVSTVLACLAVDRRLGGVLFIDLPPALLTRLARWLNSMLADGSAEPEPELEPEVITLGATHTDDDLWWTTRPVATDGKPRFETVPGPLIDVPGGPPRTVAVPDLARASLAVARAAVTLIGSDTAVADRRGRHASWQPRSRWIAACGRSDLGKLSAHLLDRFVVRVDATGLWRHDRDPRAMRELLDAGGDESAPLDVPGPALRGLWNARHCVPFMTVEAIDMVMAVAESSTAAPRRDLALARVARALATLDSGDAVLADHVLRAARVLGLDQPDAASPPDAEPAPPPDAPPDPAAHGRAAAERSPKPERVTVPGEQQDVPALLDDLTVTADLLRTRMYPEDDPDSISEYSPLRQKWQQHSRPRAGRGNVIGTEPTRSLADVAFVPTALEAAKFAPIRRLTGLATKPGDLVIVGSDLRRYRHQPQPDTGVVLVLDHTCRRDWDWSAALAPYLRWAYVRQAVISVIECGYLGNADELRATGYRTASVLDRRIQVSLSREPGRATPLAHALDLSVQELRRHLRRAEVASTSSWLVVVSDGRGNVPLEASQRGRVRGIVAREGVTDALLAASAVRSLPPVNTVVLAPPRLTHHAELPFELADALGGIVEDGGG